MRSKLKHSITLLPVILLAVGAGCDNATPLNKDFGNAVRHNMAVQIINPSPDYTGLGPPRMDGVRAAGALERYKEGEVIKPKIVPTSGKGE